MQNILKKFCDQIVFVLPKQGRRRVFKSGPAEEAIECRGGEHKRGVIPPLVRGVRGSPPRKFLNFERFYVRF